MKKVDTGKSLKKELEKRVTQRPQTAWIEHGRVRREVALLCGGGADTIFRQNDRQETKPFRAG
jgi:hypothetical protein